MIGLPESVKILLFTVETDMRKGFGAPGKAWCVQRVEFPSRQEVEPPHWESSLGRVEVTT